MKVTVASGKGGTGKTMLATSHARALADLGRPTTYVDADVEEPNGHLFLRPERVEEHIVTAKIPALTRESCSGCGECQKICAFGAILALKDQVMVLEPLCHSCGACVVACPERVLQEKSRRVGVTRNGWSGDLEVRWGAVDIGEQRAEPVLEELVRDIEADSGRLYVIDAPPGTSCLPMADVGPSDLVVLITEPTPLGLHDVRLALRMASALGVPARAVINKSDLGGEAVATYLRSEGVPIVAKIPFDEGIARAYAVGEPPALASAALSHAVDRIAEELVGDRSIWWAAP